MKNILAIILLLAMPSLLLADGVNKPKRKSKPKPHITQPKVTAKVKPKLPSLLETKYELAVTPELRPLRPLLDIPVVPQSPLVESEIRVFEFEQKKRSGLFFLIGGAAIPVIAILLRDEDSVTPPLTPPVVITPQIVPVSVPETGSLLLFGSALLLMGMFKGVLWG